MGRMSSANTGKEARNESGTIDRSEIPYKRKYRYSAFGNTTSRKTFTWSEQDDEDITWVNNRASAWSYDADGSIKSTQENSYYYNASGRVVMSTLISSRRTICHVDIEGKTVRRSDYRFMYGTGYALNKTEYQIYSAVLGNVLTEVNNNGTRKKTNVYGLGGTVIATQNMLGASTQHVAWQYMDPSNASYISAVHDGSLIYTGDNGQAELDPEMSDVGTSAPSTQSNFSSPGSPWETLGAVTVAEWTDLKSLA